MSNKVRCGCNFKSIEYNNKFYSVLQLYNHIPSFSLKLTFAQTCNNDFFAFNYKTANSMREKMLNFMSAKNNTSLVEMKEINRKTFDGLELGSNSTSSLASAFFNNGRGITTHQKHLLLPPRSVTLGESLKVFNNTIDFIEPFNKERTIGLQPNFVPDSQQGLLRYLKVLFY